MCEWSAFFYILVVIISIREKDRSMMFMKLEMSSNRLFSRYCSVSRRVSLWISITRRIISIIIRKHIFY